MSGLAETELDQAGWVIWAKRGGGAVLMLLLVVGIWFVAKTLSAPSTPHQRQIAKIRIVPDTPPPPPPPKEEKPQPKEVKETKIEQPKDQPKPMEAEPLKMEGQGSDKGLAGVAAGTVSSDYIGQKLGDGNRYARYMATIQLELNRALQKVDKLRSADYRVIVHLWLNPDGTVTKAELADSTGNADLDERMRKVLAQLPPMRERPPEDMPQPVRVRLTSR
jgi:periplasmic protein TonB